MPHTSRKWLILAAVWKIFFLLYVQHCTVDPVHYHSPEEYQNGGAACVSWSVLLLTKMLTTREIILIPCFISFSSC